ncbi:hypothetical protein [uncultured Winogradskyella sp.]|uniref:hypothetical protein n=1 Tax=uncultured Winogradskyella sp. TaxID=395353 RepID=UPI00262D0809|nr:hypothetical protein [uncultured Winogradskyella sp.]
MKHFLIIILSIITLNSINCQDYKFGEISKLELQEKYYPMDSAANAAILYRNENISFEFSQNNGFTQLKEIIMKIKIYNKEGLDWANEKIILYQGRSGNNISIKGIKGYTYNLEEGKIKKDKLKNEGIFTEKATNLYSISSFTLPNVKAGSIVEYRYVIRSPFIQIDDVELQFSIPVKKLDVNIFTPQFYNYKKLLNPKAFYTPSYIEKKIYKTISMTQRVSNNSPKSGVNQLGNGSTISKNKITYFDNKIVLSEENIPSLRAESFAGSINNYKAKLSLELEAKLSIEGYLEKSYATSWEKVAKTIYESPDFGGQLGDFSIYKDDLEAILAGVTDDFEKAFLVENFVKSRVKWNGSYGKYAQKGIRLAYKEHDGNVADINLMVVSMLRSQGVNANPVILSTRNNGTPLFPTREGFNYVICSVENDGEMLLIDATEQYSTNNVLPKRVLNWQGRLIENEKVSRWINMKPSKNSVESTMLNVTIDDDFTVSGKVVKHLTNYIAYSYRNKYASMTNEDHIKSLEKDKGAIEINELSIDNVKNATHPIKVSYEYELSDGIEEVGDKIYFSPMLFFATKENPFKLEERQYPIDFVIPYSEKYMVNIKLPEGYTVESLPNSEGLEFKDANVKFTYLIQQNGDFLQLKAQLDIVNPLILPKDYKDFKAFYSKIVEKQAEQIVLNKV